MSKFKVGDEVEILDTCLKGNRGVIIKQGSRFRVKLSTDVVGTFDETSLKLLSPKFKVGDEVELLESYYQGQRGVVVESGVGTRVKLPNGVELTLWENLMKLVPKFKVGDKVKVLRKFGTEYKGATWISDMDKTVGCVGEVTLGWDEKYNGRVHVKFPIPIDLAWYYSPDVLELVKEEPKFKVGDKVWVGGCNKGIVVREGYMSLGVKVEGIKEVHTYREGTLRHRKEEPVEVGKYYRTPGGHKVRIYALDGAGGYAHGARLADGEWNVETFAPSFVDKFVPWVDPHPAESWPVDAKIRVRQGEGEPWDNRHFAKFEDGRVFAWSAGGTSFTSLPSDTSSWRFAELVEE